ncbi:MAG: hypothetical protein HKN74_07115 [Acidimicrobiia bacterium]|nr:hypothetical protein [Acidimicrobiia bacterium]NNF10035.1 hypothetical protein [Acidimicrobiia bacterium]NNL71709.1 hypothetical protein [Acidimicrobiia bacterium]
MFKRKKQQNVEPPAAEHAVIARYQLSDDEFGGVEERESFFTLEDGLIGTIEAAGAGELDGHEFGGGEAVIYMYGPDGDRLFACVEGILRSHGSRPATCTVRYGAAGDPAVRQRIVDLRAAD